jgi:hypothetical protein
MAKNKKNDFIDSMHARVALSYSDYFFIRDNNLESTCKQVIDEKQLNIEINPELELELCEP